MPKLGLSSPICLCVLFTASCLGASTVNYQVTAVPGGLPGQPLFRYSYYLSGFDFVTNQELDFVFPASQFGSLSNGIASPGFDVDLFQPNVPIGSAGDFTALALSDLGDVTGPWSVDVVYLGDAEPGSQSFFINQFDNRGVLIGDPVSGRTKLLSTGGTIPAPDSVPEPSTLVLAAIVVLPVGLRWAFRDASTFVSGRHR